MLGSFNAQTALLALLSTLCMRWAVVWWHPCSPGMYAFPCFFTDYFFAVTVPPQEAFLP